MPARSFLSGGANSFAAASSGVTDHGALTGLADDDHTQYARLAANNTFTATPQTITADDTNDDMIVLNHAAATPGGEFIRMKGSDGTSRIVIGNATSGGWGMKAGTLTMEGSNNFIYADSGSLLIGSGANSNAIKIGHGDGCSIGFYNKTPIVKQTGVAVSTAGIHAALVALGLFDA